MIKLVKSTFYKEKETKKKLSRFILKSKHLSFGKECIAFEEKFAKWQGRKKCILVNSGSSANLAIIQALLNLGKIRKGDRIGFSAITWSTNVMPLIELGLVPTPIDVSIKTLNVSSETLIAAIKTHRIKLLFLTNLLGFCSDLDVIRSVCKKNNILLVEDACEALGSVYKGKKLGNFGIASTFSFYVGHHMSTIEGGAICTDDIELSEMLSLVRAHGWDRNLSFTSQARIRKRFKVNSSFYSRYTFYDLGYNFRPTELVGFVGQIQMKYINKVIQIRQKNFKQLARRLYTNSNYYPIDFQRMDCISNFAIPLICKSVEIRDELVKRCEGKVEIRPIVGGDMTHQPFMKKYVREKNKACPVAHLIHQQGLYFGNNPELTKKELLQLSSLFTIPVVI